MDCKAASTPVRHNYGTSATTTSSKPSKNQAQKLKESARNNPIFSKVINQIFTLHISGGAGGEFLFGAAVSAFLFDSLGFFDNGEGSGDSRGDDCAGGDDCGGWGRLEAS